ncbi:hypothetical protein TG4357_03291 [Thalassovita gelatinovora]|uniref:DUF1800 domain-containing protein n=1 Tax=Thalassovita gelatinovora TaxID=53501 RepID=A0A0P1G6X5_THAGE|nr:DUF1800 domain-containing protein [Thalassovita gelatinovora]QIZ81539.1 DUF1800 domain-containing protein [Thalassovita gelatinovora]CUH67934.1 hypothetical protein TG4357_03291 [Thalassovita gelatinovora]SEQ25764.1 Uncharacterized conserved protein, DUF1800 family [Thalassovita gelatinovora]
MTFDPILAEKRFGYGLSPRRAAPESVADMLTRLQASDDIAAQFPVEPFSIFLGRMHDAQMIRKDFKKLRGTDAGKALQKQLKLIKKDARQQHRHWLVQTMLRRVWTGDGFRERLSAFWADHFTAQGKAGLLKRGTTPYIEDAIRPHLTGRFADLLYAVTTSPLMVHYLDQENSMGPGSRRAEKRGAKAGLNENLARELLELHTLGVGAPYGQADVRQLAELLTGLTYSAQDGTKFRKDFAEPGTETVLGKTYGGGQPGLGDIRAVLEDLAAHPATAQHIARKLAVHFVSDTPDPDLVQALAQRYRDTGGDLAQVYDALLTHPAAWQPEPGNIKLPDEFIASTMRALAVDPQVFSTVETGDQHEKLVIRLFLKPLQLMGQPWQAPLGPDGWTEVDTAWLTPQGLTARIDWAMSVPAKLRNPLPDPRHFVTDALGRWAPEPVQFAAKAAENRRVGIALILASPAFQRK